LQDGFLSEHPKARKVAMAEAYVHPVPWVEVV
ncbi:unnamed protein product, partial [marine sediment metagenome]